jgi:hypothetical protein
VVVVATTEEERRPTKVSPRSEGEVYVDGGELAVGVWLTTDI